MLTPKHWRLHAGGSIKCFAPNNGGFTGAKNQRQVVFRSTPKIYSISPSAAAIARRVSQTLWAGTVMLCNCQEHAAAGSLSPEAPCRLAPPATADLCMFDGCPNYRWGSAKFETRLKCFPPATATTRGSRTELAATTTLRTFDATRFCADGPTWSSTSTAGSRSTTNLLSPE